jgi:hypothetical protein
VPHLLKHLSAKQSSVKRINDVENEAATKVSFQTAGEIAAAAGKSFTEAAFVKKCLLTAPTRTLQSVRN